ncbi:MAG TPA: S8 family serine peptidase [Candidatus Eisenbacteria bacterium]|nr:S8 family serine peptidase [Candidatus Eisenbacteria bacterium]
MPFPRGTFAATIHPRSILAALLFAAAAAATPASALDLPAVERYLVRGRIDTAAARARGLIAGASAGGWTTIRISPGRADALRSLPGVTAIARAPSCRLLLDAVAADTRLALVRSVGPNGVNGPSGTGVLIGVIDTGIDLGHADFRRADGGTRVLALWDQTTASGSPPPGYAYGSEWTASQIDAGMALSTDEEGHGTHVAGIAAGNGRGGAAGLDAGRYVGIAPEAALCIVKADFTGPGGASAADILDAVDYIFAKAASLSMPAVVNLSFGSHEGPHDGTLPFDEMLEAMAGPGRILVGAAGNEGADRVHGRVDPPAGGTSELTFRIPMYAPKPGAANDVVRLSAWYDRGDSMAVTLVTPGGTTLGPFGPGSASGVLHATSEGRISVCLGDCTASGLAPAEISVTIDDGAESEPPGSGLWKFRLTRGAAGGSGRVDAYVADQYLGASAPSVVWILGAVSYGTVRSPASSDSVIAVGAHVAKPCWTSIDGETNCAGSPSSTGQLAFFSSRGPRRDGARKPEICAPGLVVASSRSAAATFDAWETVPGGAHAILLGTSMSAPSVTGAVALLLARAGWAAAGPTAVRAQLTANARTDGFTGATPNDSWGYGKLDILSLLSMSPTAVETADDVPRARFALSNAAPNPFNPSTSTTLDLPSEGRVSVRVHDVSGRRVRGLAEGSRPAGRHRVTWDGRDDRGLSVASGVYYLVVSVDGLAVTRKVTLLK